MSTVFEKIIASEIPGNFVWSDESCVAFTTIEPVQPGHILVVPREPIDSWTDLPPELAGHLMNVSQIIGSAQMEAFEAPRTALVIAGFEVPHTHLHLIPAYDERDTLLDGAQAATPAALTDAANSLRDILRKRGYHADIPWEVNAPASPAAPAR